MTCCFVEFYIKTVVYRSVNWRKLTLSGVYDFDDVDDAISLFINITASHGSAYTVVRATQQVNGK